MEKLEIKSLTDKRDDFYFFWNSNINPFDQKKPQWTPYKLQDNFYLEECFQKFKTGDLKFRPELGDYFFDFKNMIQIHKKENWRQRPILRQARITVRNVFRKERFNDSQGLEMTSKIREKFVEEKLILNKINCEFSKVDFQTKVFSIILDDDLILDVLKEHDIMEDLEKLDFVTYLKLMKIEIQNLSVKEKELNYYVKPFLNKINKQNFYEIIIRMYSVEGFLYKSINKILGQIKNQKDFQQIKYFYYALMASIQKFSGHSNEILKLLKFNKEGKFFVYRGIKLTQKEAENYNKNNSVRIFNNFLSTTFKKKNLIKNIMEDEYLMEIEVDISFIQNFIFMDEISEFISEKEILIKSGSVILFHGIEEELSEEFDKRVKVIKCCLISLDLGGLLKYLNYDGSITKINMNDNNLGNNMDFIRILSESLKNNKTLLHIGLDWNYLGNSTESMRLLCKALEINNTLEEINLNYNNLGSNTEAILLLSDAIAINNSITTIHLSMNNLGNNTEAFKVLCEKLKINTSLNNIFLLKNKLGSNTDAIKYLCDVIQTNSSIKEIDLRDNNLNSNTEAMKLLDSAMKAKCSIKLAI